MHSMTVCRAKPYLSAATNCAATKQLFPSLSLLKSAIATLLTTIENNRTRLASCRRRRRHCCCCCQVENDKYHSICAAICAIEYMSTLAMYEFCSHLNRQSTHLFMLELVVVGFVVALIKPFNEHLWHIWLTETEKVLYGNNGRIVIIIIFCSHLPWQAKQQKHAKL